MHLDAQTVATPDREPRTIVPAGTLAARRTARPTIRLQLLAALVVAWALIYLAVYVPARGNGSDFQVFYAGAYADAHGSDPFDWPQLWRVEQVLYNHGLGRHGGFVFAPYGDPPPFALAIRPLTLLGERDAYRVWAALLLGCGVLGAYLCLAGWTERPRRLAALLVAICPAALFDLRLGQNATPLLLCLGLAISLRAARMPGAAGAALALGLYKPHLMLPVAVIVLLSTSRQAWRAMAGGFALTAAAGVIAGITFDGGTAAYRSWLGSVRGFGDLIRHQPDLASVPGIYLGSSSPALSGSLNGCCLGVAAAIIAMLAVSAQRGGEAARLRLLGGGIATYMALSPYVHTSDQVLLTLPLLLLIGPTCAGLRDAAVLLAASATILAPIVVIRDYHTVGINALPPLCIALAYWLQRSGIPPLHSTAGDSADVTRARATPLVPDGAHRAHSRASLHAPGTPATPTGGAAFVHDPVAVFEDAAAHTRPHPAVGGSASRCHPTALRAPHHGCGGPALNMMPVVLSQGAGQNGVLDDG